MRTVDIKSFDIVVACKQTFYKTDKRFFAHRCVASFELFGVDHADSVIERIHISVRIRHKNDVALCCCDVVVCHIDDDFGFAGALGTRYKFDHKHLRLYYIRFYYI